MRKMKKRYLSLEKRYARYATKFIYLFLNRCCLWSKRLKGSLSCSDFLLWTFNQGEKVTAANYFWHSPSVFPCGILFLFEWVIFFLMNESPSPIINSPYYQMTFLKFDEKYVFIPAWVSSRAKQNLREKLGFSNTSPPENASGNLFWNGYWNICKAHYQHILSKNPNHNYFW